MGEKLGFRDIIDLAKAGYKPGDVKELLQIANEQKAVPEEPPVTTPKEDVQPEVEKAPNANADKPVSETQPEQSDALKELQSQIETLKAQSDEKDKLIKQIQKDNASRNIKTETQEKTEDEVLADIVRNFM